MTAHFVHPMLYRCDHPGCSVKHLAPDGELPQGWTASEPQMGDIDGAYWAAYTRHYCPDHKPAEAK